MGVLVCAPREKLWMMHRDKPPCAFDCPFLSPCAPCTGGGRVALCCRQLRECLCLGANGMEIISRMPALPAVCGMCFSSCGGMLYQLSSEADCVHALNAKDGTLLYSAPVGVFPRSMRLSPSGKSLLCAGGASNESLLLKTTDLSVMSRVETPSPCLLADFWAGGLVLVCAAESEGIQTVVYTLGLGGLREVAQTAGLPCALCVCPDGKSALLSTHTEMLKMDLSNGNVQWRSAQWALCMRAECRQNHALLSDLPDGSVWLVNHQRPRHKRLLACFEDSQACFV